MKKEKKDNEREERIAMEIIVDANGPEEQAMGWYYYLEDKLHFPFTAICNAGRSISPLHVNDEVEIYGMAPKEECEREMFVTMQWEKDGLAVPLSQLLSASQRQRLLRQLKIGIIGSRWGIHFTEAWHNPFLHRTPNSRCL